MRRSVRLAFLDTVRKPVLLLGASGRKSRRNHCVSGARQQVCRREAALELRNRPPFRMGFQIVSVAGSWRQIPSCLPARITPSDLARARRQPSRSRSRLELGNTSRTGFPGLYLSATSLERTVFLGGPIHAASRRRSMVPSTVATANSSVCFRSSS
jgi:hypothetical protein